MPESLKNYALDKLHTLHQGIEKSKLLAKDSVFWVNINDDIEKMIKSCPECSKFSKSKQKEPLKPHNIPDKPWITLGTDLFEFENDHYLVVADYFLKFPIVEKLPKNPTSEAVIKKLSKIFSLFGIPLRLVSDNGPQYSAEKFKIFTKNLDIEHVTTSPHYAQSNGFIERNIQTIKNSMKKS